MASMTSLASWTPPASLTSRRTPATRAWWTSQSAAACLSFSGSYFLFATLVPFLIRCPPGREAPSSYQPSGGSSCRTCLHREEEENPLLNRPAGHRGLLPAFVEPTTPRPGR